MLIGSIVGAISGLKHGGKKINGTVVLVRDNVLDFNDFGSTVLDNVHELLGGGVSLQLVSAQHGDPCEFFFVLTIGLWCFFVLIFHQLSNKTVYESLFW